MEEIGMWVDLDVDMNALITMQSEPAPPPPPPPPRPLPATPSSVAATSGLKKFKAVVNTVIASNAMMKPTTTLESMRKRASTNDFVQDTNLLQLQNTLTVGTSDDDTMRYIALVCFEKLSTLAIEKQKQNTSSKSHAMWLIYRSPKGARTAYPLRPRIDSNWILEENLGVELSEEDSRLSVSGSTRQLINKIFSLLLIALDIDPPVYDHRFVSVLWECNDKTAADIVRSTKKEYVMVIKYPEVGNIWVYKDDKQSFEAEKLLAASERSTNSIKSQIDRSAGEVMSSNKENMKTLSMKIDDLNAQLSSVSGKLLKGIEGAAAQAASNPALLDAIRRLGNYINSANSKMDESIDAKLNRLEESMQAASDKASGGVQVAISQALEESRSLREEDPEAINQIMKSLGGLSKQIGNIDGKLEKIEGNLREAVKGTRDNMKVLRTLAAVAGSDGKLPPKIIYIYPKEEKKTTSKMKSLFKSKGKSLLTNTVYVTFICPVTLKTAQCGPDGKGFEVQQPKETLKKAMPYEGERASLRPPENENERRSYEYYCCCDIALRRSAHPRRAKRRVFLLSSSFNPRWVAQRRSLSLFVAPLLVCSSYYCFACIPR